MSEFPQTQPSETGKSGHSRPKPGRRGVWRVAMGLLRMLRSILLGIVLLWASLALYYAEFEIVWLGTVLALGFLIFGIWALWVSRKRAAKWAFAAAYLAVLVWWGTIHPSHDREWRPEVGEMPRAIIDGDLVRMSNVRDFDYENRDDFTVRYVDREFRISDVTSVDFFISYWKKGPVGHTFVSFNLANDEPVCISIETRPEVGEGFDPLASLFKRFELIYVVGNEHDIVGSRTNHRDEDVFLYRLRAGPESARNLLRVYLDRINQLADEPEFYHLLSNSCTINIIRYANAAGRQGRLDYRHILNGFVDQYLYHAGFLQTGGLSFSEYRQKCWINDEARQADVPSEFPERIRAGLPTH